MDQNLSQDHQFIAVLQRQFSVTICHKVLLQVDISLLNAQIFPLIKTINSLDRLKSSILCIPSPARIHFPKTPSLTFLQALLEPPLLSDQTNNNNNSSRSHPNSSKRNSYRLNSNNNNNSSNNSNNSNNNNCDVMKNTSKTLQYLQQEMPISSRNQ